jgi:hypothetical protein
VSARPALSVIVASVDGATVGQTVASLRAAIDHAGVPVEVILAWQGEGDPPALDVQVARALPLGLSVNRNTGFAASHADLVAFVDDDELIDRGWVAAVLEAFADARVDAAFGQVLPADGDGLPHCELIIPARQLLRGRRRAPWDIGTGGNMAFRRTALAALGGFDARLGAGTPSRSGEDADIISRLQARGAVLARWPAMIVRHPTKSPSAERASRRPYGRGMGVLARRRRSAALVLNFVSAASWELLAVLRGRDPQRALELGETALGWLDGMTAADRWLAPPSLVENAPAAIRERLGTRKVTGLPMARRGDLHVVYACGGDLMLHVRTGDRERLARATAAQRALGGLAGVPPVRAVAGDGAAHWVLEDRLAVRPLTRDPAAWWPLACDWVAELSRQPAGERGWIERTARAFPAVAGALRRAAELPAAPAHGDLGPGSLFGHAGGGLAVLGWEAAEPDAPMGIDLLALATRIQGDEGERLDMLNGLLAGREPRTGPVLGPLAGLGVPADAVPALVAAALAQLAGREAARAAALGVAPGPLVYRPLLERLGPRLAGG